ncbi:hypothetical protein [Nocardioides sp. URHA0032]|uniref:hypothetical protein n=1 Tax=Nocardioides sp. URHA0032 TaxID=1380388 RepID=UPI0012DF0673|nr:hypothetical protein [Nocardioides sp. URHA0032]
MTDVEACPACLGEIPPSWRSAKVTCVAMSGARATGKSLMLAAAKAQLELLVERHHRSALRGIGETERIFYDTYTRRLQEERQLLAPTASIGDDQTTAREPLMFGFTEVMPDNTRRSRVLVMRDVAGEDLEDKRDLALSFFSRADAVIALLDPLKVPAIRHMLSDAVPSDSRVGGDGTAVLQHLLSLMTGKKVGARTGIPLAVVLSKFDTMQELRRVEGTEWSRIMNRPGSPLQRDPSLRSAWFDAADADLLHMEVRALLDRLEATGVTAMIEESAESYRYFAVSALGASPEGEMLHSGGMAPFRVLDPFKWALQVAG